MYKSSSSPFFVTNVHRSVAKKLEKILMLTRSYALKPTSFPIETLLIS